MVLAKSSATVKNPVRFDFLLGRQSLLFAWYKCILLARPLYLSGKYILLHTATNHSRFNFFFVVS